MNDPFDWRKRANLISWAVIGFVVLLMVVAALVSHVSSDGSDGTTTVPEELQATFDRGSDAMAYGEQAGYAIVAEGINVTGVYMTRGPDAVKQLVDALCGVQLASIPVDHPEWGEFERGNAEYMCHKTVMENG